MDRLRAASTGSITMKQLLYVSLFLLIGACTKPDDNGQAPAPVPTAMMQEEPAKPSASYEEAHAAAVAAIDYSVTRGHAWSTSDALLEQAVAANADGNDALAIELADSARIQAELAAKQADIEEGTWQERVLSD